MDAYDQAFVLLALSTVYQFGRDAQCSGRVGFADGILSTATCDPHMVGLSRGIPATLPRRQNPQMHLFEAMIAAFEATGDHAFRNCAGELFGLFVANLYDPRRQVLGEYFEEDWSKIEPVSVEPGHQAEWVWLLKSFERITDCPTAGYRAGLLASALRFRDDVTGCLFDEGDAETAM